MGRPIAANLPVLGGNRAVAPNQERVLPESVGHETRQASWDEEGQGSLSAEDSGRSPLHLGRRHFVRMEAGEGSLSITREVPDPAYRVGDVPLGRWLR